MLSDGDIDHMIETIEHKKMTYIPLSNRVVRDYLRCLGVYFLIDYRCSVEDLEAVLDLVVSVNRAYLSHCWETEERLDTLSSDPSFIVCLYMFFKETSDWFRNCTNCVEVSMHFTDMRSVGAKRRTLKSCAYALPHVREDKRAILKLYGGTRMIDLRSNFDDAFNVMGCPLIFHFISAIESRF